MPDQEKRSLEEKLRTIIQTVDVANAMTEPLTESIKNLLYLSARSMKSEEASVIIRDGDEGDLRFLSAIGQVADQLVGMKIPSGKGIAGFVFSSGQPMAVADLLGTLWSVHKSLIKRPGIAPKLFWRHRFGTMEKLLGF